jgi:hypothetical protein
MWASQRLDFLLAADLVVKCLPLAEADRELSPEKRRELTETYAARAVAILSASVRAGKVAPEDLKGAEQFVQLRTREDFQKLLTDTVSGP